MYAYTKIARIDYCKIKRKRKKEKKDQIEKF